MKAKIILLISALFLGLLQYRLWYGLGNIKEVRALAKLRETEQENLDQLLARNQKLFQDIAELKSDPKMVEEKARVGLGMVKQGETFCLVIEPGR